MTLEIYDTTLRDGSQQEGISLMVNDKLRIAGLLDDLGVAFIRGMAGSGIRRTPSSSSVPRLCRS